MTAYRELAEMPAVATLAWFTSSWARLWVRLCRVFFWTLAARRQRWRQGLQRYEAYKAGRIKTGRQRISIRADNGSVVKNVYVDHGKLSLQEEILFQAHRRGHLRMPRT